MIKPLTNWLRPRLQRNGFNFTRTRAIDPVRVLTPAGFMEYSRLLRDPSPDAKTTNALGPELRIFSGGVFCHMLDEIWCRECYDFPTDRADPRVIDCGANIGLATLFVKTRWPRARVTAFEANPQVFDALAANVAAFGFDDVDLVRKAVWSEEAELEFALGATSTTGRVKTGGEGGSYKVTATRLYEYLDEPIDFLKIDIEGAELEVLLDCVDRLDNVKSLFVEYHSQVDQPQRFDELLRVLAAAGFRVYLEKEGRVQQKPLKSVEGHNGFDLAVNVFARR